MRNEIQLQHRYRGLDEDGFTCSHFNRQAILTHMIHHCDDINVLKGTIKRELEDENQTVLDPGSWTDRLLVIRWHDSLFGEVDKELGAALNRFFALALAESDEQQRKLVAGKLLWWARCIWDAAQKLLQQSNDDAKVAREVDF